MNRRHLLQGLSMSLLSGKLLQASPLDGQAMATNKTLDSDHSSAPAKTFIVGHAIRDIDAFRKFAQTASRLKSNGDVQIEVGGLADKSWYEMPPFNSPWHEYANGMPCMAHFFPHPKIAPFIPADWVAKNREQLLARTKVIRELGLNGAFFSDETHFFPAPFFEQYPHLRGPRIDHPRRSNRQEFSWCVDLEETREMIEWMTAELLRHVPEIKTIASHNNDAGGGLCWAAALYTGPNGPHHCEDRSAGLRVKEYVEAIHRGAQKGGGDIVYRMNGLFYQNEDTLIQQMLPPNSYLDYEDGPVPMGISSLLNRTYPVKNLLDPVSLISTLEKLKVPEIKYIYLGTSAWYSRADDTLRSVEKLVDMGQDCLSETTQGMVSRFDKLHKLALRWGGKENADALVEAFYEMNEAFLLKNMVAPDYSNYYCFVSMRYITRPLLFKPDVLTAQEEAYFLPYVFNIFESEARNDYADFHGGRMKGPATWDDDALQNSITRALHAAQILEGITGAPSQEWLKDTALSLRMWVCAVRSMNNFYFAQLIRDRTAGIVAKGTHIPNKQFTATGDEDYLAWDSIQRDELDNTNELIALLQKGGLELTAYSKTKKYEDTFLLGPDLIAELHEKTRLMQREWLDVQKYLASPML